MIDGAHIIIYSKDAEADKLGLYQPRHARP